MAITQDTDRFSTDAGRLPTSANRACINRNTGSFIWEMDVIGTHFPALPNSSNSLDSDFTLVSEEPNTLIIDFQDGTGEHVYPFVLFGDGKYYARLGRLPNNSIGDTPTPENISKPGVGYFPVYFYQDLPLPSGTVDDLYDHPRKIIVQIEKFFLLENFSIWAIGIYGQIPSILNRLISLNTLSIDRTYHMTGFSSSFSRTFCESLTFSLTGFSLGNVVPDFILNSKNLTSVSLNNMMDLSTDASSTRLDDLLGSTSFCPNLNSFVLTNCNITFQLPNLKRTMTGVAELNSMPPGFMFSPDLSTYDFIFVSVINGHLAESEHVRIMEESSIERYSMVSCTVNNDLDLSVDNHTIKTISIGRGTSFGGFVPTFLSRLKASEIVRIGIIESAPFSDLSSWGTAGLSSTVKSLEVYKETAIPPTLPVWFSNLVNLQTLYIDCYDTQIKIDDHVESFYAITSSTTAFDGLNYTLFGGTLANTISVRPSGIYQDPNGAPTTPMEMIWKLVNEHNMIVTVLNTAGDGKDIYT